MERRLEGGPMRTDGARLRGDRAEGEFVKLSGLAKENKKDLDFEGPATGRAFGEEEAKSITAVEEPATGRGVEIDG